MSPFGATTATPSLVPHLLLLLLLSTSAVTINAHNITAILARYPQFSEFNDLLTKTGAARDVNNRQPTTVLAVANDNIGNLAGQPPEVQQRIIRSHVVLDYFDAFKLRKLTVGNKTQATTMFQSSGTAQGMQGFINVIRQKDNSIIFCSAVLNAPADVTLVQQVAEFPYNISVLSISHPLVVPGLDGTMPPVAAPPPKAARSPAPSTKDVPPPASETPAESPEEEPADEAPTESPEPSEGPSAGPAEAPDADSADNDTLPPPRKSAADKMFVSGFTLASAMIAVASLFVVA